MCSESHGRLLPFCNIDPRGISNSPDANFSLWLEHYKKRGCIGVGEVMPNLPFGDPRCQNLFKHVETVGLPFTFDISAAIGGNYGFYDDPGLPQLELTLRKFPKLNICCHGPAFWAEISTLDTPADRFIYPRYPVRAEGVVPKLFRRYANAWGDLSARSAYYALSRDADFAVSFITEFQDKLMFATDICYADMELPMAGFLQGLRDQKRISEEIFEKVAHKNARRLFGLDSSFPE
jgi:predicted TIM-barrel fold metal-dependent hydrolase